MEARPSTCSWQKSRAHRNYMISIIKEGKGNISPVSSVSVCLAEQGQIRLIRFIIKRNQTLEYSWQYPRQTQCREMKLQQQHSRSVTTMHTITPSLRMRNQKQCMRLKSNDRLMTHACDPTSSLCKKCHSING